MKVGDVVEIRDGSYATTYAGGTLVKEGMIACKPAKYIVLLIQDGLPALRDYPLPPVIKYDNDVLLQDLNDPTHLVFARVAFLRSAELTATGMTGTSLAEALKEARAFAIELFGSACCHKLILDLADVLQKPKGHQRDRAFAECIVKMHRRFAA